MIKESYAKGLEGVIAAESQICLVDGERGELLYRGYPIEELAKKCSFEEVTYLLLHGHLPNRKELEHFQEKMCAGRELQLPVLTMIEQFPSELHPMELLQSCIAYLSGYVDHKIRHSATCYCTETLHQIPQLASVVAAFYRIRQGKEYIPPKKELTHGANFLYMLRGKEPDPYEGQIMDACLVIHAEHSFNASTFTARVVASTFSTCYCSISAAIGALYGSLHGGANERVMEMVEKIGTKKNVEPWLTRAFAEKKKISGMGHRVYKVRDPRAVLMEQYLLRLSEEKGDTRLYHILKEIQRVFRASMEEKGKPVYANVDFFSGAVYDLLGIPRILFTPIFAIARVSGWLAHILEQRSANRLFRPKALYVGPNKRSVPALSERKG